MFNENPAKCNYTNSAFSQVGSYFKEYKYVQDHSLCFKNGPYVHEIVSSDYKKLIDMNLGQNDTTETSQSFHMKINYNPAMAMFYSQYELVFLHEQIPSRSLDRHPVRRLEQIVKIKKNSTVEETQTFSFENLGFYEEYIQKTYQCTHNKGGLLYCLEKPRELLAITQPIIYFKSMIISILSFPLQLSILVQLVFV